MDTERLLVLLIVLAAIAAGCTTPAGGRWPREGVASPRNAAKPAVVVPANQLALSIVAERDHYLVGEPVYVAVTLRNTGGQSERVIGTLQPEDGAVDFVITAADGSRRRFVPLGEADHDAGFFTTLAPGATIGNMVPIFFGGSGWTFAKSGRYTVTGYYRLPDGKGTVREAESSPMTIAIESFAEGSSLIGDGGPVSKEIGKFLVWQSGDHLEKGRARLGELIQRSPDSVLASYANFALGRSWGDSFMDYRKRQVRQPNCELAMQHLSKVRDTHIADFVRSQHAITSARCMARARNAAAARRHLGTARAIVGNKPEYRGIAGRMDELEKFVLKLN